MKGEFFGATCDICGGPGIAKALDWVGPNVHTNAAACRHWLLKRHAAELAALKENFNESQECKSEAGQVDQAEDGLAVAYLHASRSLC